MSISVPLTSVVSHEGKYCTFNKILVRKAKISVESYLVYQSVSQKSILFDVYFITLNDIDRIIYANYLLINGGGL